MTPRVEIDPAGPPTFDAADPGTTADQWMTSGRLRPVPALDPTSVRALIVVVAHPDDETLGAGGLIARCAAAGTAVTVLCATAGEGSHPQSPTTSPELLAQRRRGELLTAVSTLAPEATVEQLGLPDGRLGEHVDTLAAAIGSLLPAGATPADCWVVSTWAGDRHPDHAAVAAAVDRAVPSGVARVLACPIWAWHWADPDADDLPVERMVRVDLASGARHRKQVALGCYPSQTAPLSGRPGDEAVLLPGFLDHFTAGVEYFVARPTEGDIIVSEPATPTAPRRALPGSYFERQYDADGTDPWGFEDRWYEERKRAVTMAALPRRRFASAFEPGCAIGVLTAQLADRCDALLSTDVADAALRVARDRLHGRPHVRFARGGIPQLWPDGPFDLIVLSEVGYYCGDLELGTVIDRIRATLRPDGVLLACHWRHPVADYPLTGDEVHQRLRGETGLQILVEHVEDDFRLDVLAGPQVRSVGRVEGLAP